MPSPRPLLPFVFWAVPLLALGGEMGPAAAARTGENAEASRPAAGRTVVASSAEYPRNGEATLIVLDEGEILLLYGAHTGSGDWDRAVIRAARSSDGGRTWSQPVTQLEDPQRSLFQPSLTRMANGDFGLTHTVLAHGQDAYKVFRRSADEGRTWSDPLKISDDSHAYTTGPHDRLYTLSSGRLLALLHCNLAPKKDRQGGPLGAYAVYSDDHGQTWTRTPRDRVLHVADNPHKKHEWGFWEPSLVEHAPGKLLMMARTATGWSYECRSEDGGCTWTDPARSAVPNPLAPCVLTQIPATETLVLLHNPRVEMESGWHGGPRTVLALRTSQDAGRSWSDPQPIAVSANESDWYDYPAVRWADDTLHVAYRAITTRDHGRGGFRTVGIAHQPLMVSSLLHAAADTTPSRPLVGAIRWDAWAGGEVTAQVERTLGPKQYHTRLPWFAEVVGEDQVRIDGGRQEVMDQEIGFAARSGLDYWAFLLYPEANSMSQSLALYRSSAVRRRINFCVILHNSFKVQDAQWPRECQRAVDLLREPGYQTVLGGRPLVFAFQTREDRIAQFRQAAHAAGVDPYCVLMGWNPAGDFQRAAPLGFAAVSAYACGSTDATIAQLCQRVETDYWHKAAAAGVPYVPLVTTGWDKNPRKENPVSWEKDHGYHRQTVFPATATPAEIAAHLQRALTFVREHPETCPANTVIVYAWNEHDEGGWLCPTWTPGGTPNTGRLEAIGEVLARRP